MPKSQRYCGDRSDRAALTLLEVLVVLSVIAILAAVLLPAVVKARNRAAEVACISNCRQIHVALSLYQEDHEGRFPTRDPLGGGDGLHPGSPPASSRPLHPYLAAAEVFRCPADVGMDLRPAGGPWVKPTAFQWAGSSYLYNERGLANRRTDWVRSPSKYVVLHEPTVLRSGGDEYAGQVYVYWHRARKPGSGNGLSDEERGPRVSAILFVDGHVEFVDCSFCYDGWGPHDRLVWSQQ